MRIVRWGLLIGVMIAVIAGPVMAQSNTYTVQPGDTLYGIASRHGVTVDELRAANQLRGDLIIVGQVLIIPAASTPGLSAAPRPATVPFTNILQLVRALNHIAQPSTVESASPPTIDGADGLPSTAAVTNISGARQSLPLDCESRSAVDWAGFFGVPIDELTFFSQLPVSDNPDKGFVGDVRGVWGQIPPAPYGVHAEPIAALLRAYSLPATAHRGASWNTLRAEVAAGQPVIVWVIGHVAEGTGAMYTSSDGSTTIVAPYEHTVMVIGYTADSVMILDGDQVYTRDLNRFLNSWGALGNLAVIYNQG